jgi:WhiB family redox-sensing transcriptional regulator
MNDYPKFIGGTPACASTDPEMWFTEDDEPGYREKNLLQRICASCEVRQECLDYALRHSVHGYWAGTTPRERQRMRVKMGIVSTPIYLAWDIA